MTLDGRGVLITGGSRGLGRAVAEASAAAGARVAVVARERATVDEVVAAIRRRGGQAHGIVADVADKDSVHAIAAQAHEALGTVDVLVNNASALGPVPLRLLLDTECEDLQRALDVNLVGAFRLTKAVAGPMVLRGRGLIVNVSSDAAVVPYERWGAYGVAKAALDHLGRVWAAELAGTGVRLFTVDPGEMNTRLHAQAVPDADLATLADPADVARMILRLMADPARAPHGSRVLAREAA